MRTRGELAGEFAFGGAGLQAKLLERGSACKRWSGRSEEVWNSGEERPDLTVRYNGSIFFFAFVEWFL